MVLPDSLWLFISCVMRLRPFSRRKSLVAPFFFHACFIVESRGDPWSVPSPPSVSDSSFQDSRFLPTSLVPLIWASIDAVVCKKKRAVSRLFTGFRICRLGLRSHVVIVLVNLHHSYKLAGKTFSPSESWSSYPFGSWMTVVLSTEVDDESFSLLETK